MDRFPRAAVDEPKSDRLLAAAAASGALAVILGAFGAHALTGILDERAREVYATAGQYHFVHTLAVLAGALLPTIGSSTRLATAACIAWLVGIVVFSGSLYLLAVTGITGLGAVAPIGGLAFILGWILLLLAALRR